jgi:hypothetical protein
MAWKYEPHSLTRQELLRIRDEDYKRIKELDRKKRNLNCESRNRDS